MTGGKNSYFSILAPFGSLKLPSSSKGLLKSFRLNRIWVARNKVVPDSDYYVEVNTKEGKSL